MSVFTITLLSKGENIKIPYTLTEVDVHQEVNKIPYARLSFVDGSASKQTFDLSNSPYFVPGNEIEIKAGYEEDAKSETSIFKGIIVKHAVEADLDGSYLNLELKDKALKMTTVRKNKVHREVKEDGVFQKLVTDNGLKVGKIAATKGKHPELVQYNCSDWDFLLSRVDVQGWWVYVHQETLSVVNPAEISTSKATHTFSYGLSNIFNLHLEINAEHQVKEVNSHAWDIEKKKLSQQVKGEDTEMEIGNIDSSSLATAVGAEKYALQSIAPLLPEELKAWSDSKLLKTRWAMVRGSFSIQGIPKIQVLEVMEIEGISDRFNGKAVISGIRHRISEDGWFTDVQFGIKPDSYIDQHAVSSKPAGGLLPSIHGLQIGMVDAFEKDPDGQFRIKVKLPFLGEEETAIWARILSPDAGKERGVFFRPEVGDEVVVGFLNDDPRQAIVLGSLFSKSLPPPVVADEINEKNFIKGIFSKEGLQVKMDDENKMIQLITSEKQLISVNEKEKSIKLQDVNGNKITMNEDGILLESAKDIVLKADGNVEITGTEVDVN